MDEKKNPPAVGMEYMIKHKLNSILKPPIKSLLIVNALAQKEKKQRIRAIKKSDVMNILDKLHEAIQVGF